MKEIKNEKKVIKNFVEVESWLADVINKKKQAFELIMKFCDGFITDRIKSNISEIEVLQGIEQIKNQISHELMEFNQMESEAYFMADRIEELNPESRGESISAESERGKAENNV